MVRLVPTLMRLTAYVKRSLQAGSSYGDVAHAEVALAQAKLHQMTGFQRVHHRAELARGIAASLKYATRIMANQRIYRFSREIPTELQKHLTMVDTAMKNDRVAPNYEKDASSVLAVASRALRTLVAVECLDPTALTYLQHRDVFGNSMQVLTNYGEHDAAGARQLAQSFAMCAAYLPHDASRWQSQRVTDLLHGLGIGDIAASIRATSHPGVDPRRQQEVGAALRAGDVAFAEAILASHLSATAVTGARAHIGLSAPGDALTNRVLADVVEDALAAHGDAHADAALLADRLRGLDMPAGPTLA